jgi:adenine-specific DNA-methyltransferase
MIAGDSLLVMNSLLEKEGMAGKIQMIYIDPPYGIKYGSNFQPFVNKRNISDGKDEDLTTEPEQILAFRDTWELGIHSFLTYLRDRLLLARDLLSDRGSLFVQISDENLHHVRELLDEVFFAENFVALIPFGKTAGAGSKILGAEFDYLLWYAKDLGKLKNRQLYIPKSVDVFKSYKYAISPNTTSIRIASIDERNDPRKLPEGWKLAQLSFIVSQDSGKPDERIYTYKGTNYDCGQNRHWKTKNPEGLDRLARANRLIGLASQLNYIRYYEDFPATPITNNWSDTGSAGFSSSDPKIYVVQTDINVIQRCILMTTDPGDIVLDPTCGSGTSAFVAEQWGRRWITCDTSRVAITLAKQRLMTALFDYYQLAQPDEGVASGFIYKTVPHVTLKSIANNEPPPQEILYDQPLLDTKRLRVSGPFTMEAVPSPAVKSVNDLLSDEPQTADESVARSGETLRQAEWRDELLRTGIRGKNGQYIRFSRLEPQPGCRHLHAVGETRPSEEGSDSVHEGSTAYRPQPVVVSFGPEHAPMEQRQVQMALEEAMNIIPAPKIVVFAAFQFDPEAAKDIDQTKWAGVTLLKTQMNADLQTEDLKKKRASNESFWLIGQPDVRLEKISAGEHNGQWQVRVEGFDYYNTKTGTIESGSAGQIAMWMLDTDYDGRSLYPRQVFFPQAGKDEGWAKLAKNLKAEIDEELIEAYRGTQSLPFVTGGYRRIAVKIVDDRGIESLRILELD